MEKVQIIGNVGEMNERKGEKFLNTGTRVFEFSVAVAQGKDKDGNPRPAKWYDCKIWGDVLEGVRPYITKGKKLFVEGTPSARAYDKNGEPVGVLEVNVKYIELLGSGEDGDRAPAGSYNGGSTRRGAPENSDDIPF